MNKHIGDKVCRSLFAKNKQDLKLKVSYCTRKYKKMKDLYSAVVSVSTLPVNEKAIVVLASVDAYKKSSINKIFNTLINGISFDEN